MLTNEIDPLLLALMDKRVTAEVIDLDHYRIRGGMAVETAYIILVEPSIGNSAVAGLHPEFEGFTLSKTYSAFRTLGQQLKKAADNVTNTNQRLPKSVQKLAQYCHTVLHLVEAQPTQYLGKVNYNYVKVLAKKRSHVINEVLEATLSYFPDEITSHPFHKEVAQTIETFFLFDHCVEENPQPSTKLPGPVGNPFKTPKKRNSKTLSPEQPTDKDVRSKLKTPLQSIGEPLVEPFEKVGHAMEAAVENVGAFFKEKLGDKSKAAAKSVTPASIDTSLRSPVVPYTRHYRRSTFNRGKDDEELKEIGEEANLLLDDERPPTQLVPSYSHPLPTFGSPGSKLGDLLETNPIIFSVIFMVSATFLKYAANLTVTIDLDILLLLIWAAFCIGLHTPRPMVGGIDKSAVPSSALPTPRAKRSVIKQDTHGRQLLRQSMASTPEAVKAVSTTATKVDGPVRSPSQSALPEIQGRTEMDEIMGVGHGPMSRFPEGAPLGSKLNCWSEPVSESFQVRGCNYLKDRIKEASGPFVFPVRNVDLFLTDTCPENAGSNAGILGGALREKPTFIVNFRLPWGVLLSYFEIPERFINFVRAGHEEGFDKSVLPPLDNMTPTDRCVARFCQAPQSEKNKKLKIVPVVVEGPWIVKSVVGGKPAIVGNKLPVNYHYAPPEGGKALYLEADLDIVGSSAARGILSVARTYTQVLTIDLGFVVEAVQQDELPEQMLVGTRLHGIDPLTAPPYPLSSKELMHEIPDGDESGDEM